MNGKTALLSFHNSYRDSPQSSALFNLLPLDYRKSIPVLVSAAHYPMRL